MADLTDAEWLSLLAQEFDEATRTYRGSVKIIEVSDELANMISTKMRAIAARIDSDDERP